MTQRINEPHMQNYVDTSQYFTDKKLAYTFQVQKKLGAWENLKWSFSSNCFTAGDRHIRIISSTTVVFNENVTLCFSDNAYLFFLFFFFK